MGNNESKIGLISLSVLFNAVVLVASPVPQFV